MTLKFLLCKTQNQQSDFDYIDWSELKNRVQSPVIVANMPPEQAKKLSQAISANDAPCKTLEAAKEHNNFTLLRLDLDNVEFEINTVARLLESLCLESFLIHTTASHTPKNKRYRVYIELKRALKLEDWQMIESYLSFKFGADDCASRPQQIMYLPIDTPNYEFIINTGKAYTRSNSVIYQRAKAFQAKQFAMLEEAKLKKIRPARKLKLIGSQVSIIDAANNHFDWDDLLLAAGYKKQGKAWLCPESTSKAGGVFILTGADGKERYYSHHESDPCGTGFAIDKFDFICIRQYADNTFNAIKTLAKEYFPDLDRHNKRVYMQAKSLEKKRQAASTREAC